MLFAIAASAHAFGQDTLTAPRPFSPADTLASDSLAARRDTAATKGIDTLVTYTCSDSIVYDANTKKMSMYGRGNIKYQKIDLKAERIDLNWNTSTLAARGVPDSTNDTATQRPPGHERRGRISRTRAGQFQSKKGRIDYGDTHLDQATTMARR
jgi:hypothetical protein